MNHLSNIRVVLLGVVLAFSGCSESEPIVGTPDQSVQLTERVTMLMGGGPHANAITQTGQATAYRIGRDDDYNEVTLSNGIELTDAQRQTLAGLLARDDAYDWEFAKGCAPMNGVLVTFEDGSTDASVRFCFQCQILEYSPGSLEDFDPINAELVAWVKGVFPDDQAIQSLGTDDEAGGL